MDVRKKIVYLLLLSLFLISISYFVKNEIQAYQLQGQYNEKLKEQLFNHVYEFEENFTIKFTGNTVQIDEQLSAVMEALKAQDIYMYENISRWNAKYSYTGSSAKIQFDVDYLTTKEEEVVVSQRVEEIIQEVVQPSMTDVEKVKALHDFIVLNSAYDDATTTSQYTAYTLLTEQKGVCQAYALLMYRLLHEIGIDVMYVKGHAGGTLHGWNLVKVNGEWYHLDVTWNDPVPNRENYIGYKYFLISDEAIKKTHHWTKENYPTTTKVSYNQQPVDLEEFVVLNLMKE
jgi:transglutaminase-like putative cysteine protease